MDPWVMLLVSLAPVVMVLDLLQLVAAERYIGIRQMKAGEHPLRDAQPMPAPLTGLWLGAILFTWIYMFLLLTTAVTGFQGLFMLGVSFVAAHARHLMGLKWSLVILTIEGAVRIGLLANLLLVVFLFPESRFFNWYQSWWPV